MSTISQIYNQYYYYELPEGKDHAAVVNSLYDRVMRNDADALDKVLRILGSNTFYLVYNRLLAAGMGTVESVDDMMQTIRWKISTLAFRGFPSHVTEEYFYGYLMGIVERSVREYKKKTGKTNKKEQYETEEGSVFDFLKFGDEKLWQDPEKSVMNREWQYVKNKIFKYYERVLSSTDIQPCRAVTYCYAILLPQLFKKSKEPSFLRKVEDLSNRKSKIANSVYNEKKSCLEGEIARKSVVLINWALEAMHGKKIKELSEEIEVLYREEPLAENHVEFAWGEVYLKNLEEDCEGKPMKDVVIPDEFQKLQIKNWPERVAKALFAETEELVQQDTYFGDKSVKLAELLACG